jgi:hypothetical protein
MGSDEIATAITGAPRVIAYLTGTGCYRVQIAHFFRMQIGSRTRSGIGLGSGGRRRRMRPFLGLSRELWIQNFGGSWSRAMERKGPCLYVCTDGSGRACGVGDCTCLLWSESDPRETSGPRIDRIPPTRPSWRRRQYRELKKLIFSAPSKCPIDLFGPLANRTTLKQLLGVSIPSVFTGR